MTEIAQICVAGRWQESVGTETFRAVDPSTGLEFGPAFPVSPWAEIDAALAAANLADEVIRDWPGERFAAYLEACANGIEARTAEIIELAHRETGLAVSPRLQGGELPRTLSQMRLGARCARSGEWANPVADRENRIFSCFRSIGPAFLIGPNNFPAAFNAISGGDFVAAIAAGNPILAKAHPSHPGTSRLLAQIALQAAEDCGFPPGFVQMLYHVSVADGLRAIQDPRIAVVAFTGSRSAGLKIKAAADQAGKPVYLELSSINPVFVLDGALRDNATKLAEDFTGSCLLGTGQFCTNPGLVILPPVPEADRWVDDVRERFANSSCGPMFSDVVRTQFLAGIGKLRDAGAELLVGGEPVDRDGFYTTSTLLTISAEQFLESPEAFQQEAFGNGSLIVRTTSHDQMTAIARLLEGQLTACVYLTDDPADVEVYRSLEPVLRRKAGRLLNNKMPTGVAVSPAMNHGGPFPATGHPGFTAVGLPPAIRRFSMLQCYDNVPDERLPPIFHQS